MLQCLPTLSLRPSRSSRVAISEPSRKLPQYWMSIRHVQALQMEYVHATNAAHDVDRPKDDVPGNAREIAPGRIRHVELSYGSLLVEMAQAGQLDGTMLNTAVARVRKITRVDEIEGMRVMADGTARSWKHTGAGFAEGRAAMEAAAQKVVTAYDELVALQKQIKEYWQFSKEVHAHVEGAASSSTDVDPHAIGQPSCAVTP